MVILPEPLYSNFHALHFTQSLIVLFYRYCATVHLEMMDTQKHHKFTRQTTVFNGQEVCVCVCVCVYLEEDLLEQM